MTRLREPYFFGPPGLVSIYPAASAGDSRQGPQKRYVTAAPAVARGKSKPTASSDLELQPSAQFDLAACRAIYHAADPPHTPWNRDVRRGQIEVRVIKRV